MPDPSRAHAEEKMAMKSFKKATKSAPMGGLEFTGSCENIVSANAGKAGSISISKNASKGGSREPKVAVKTYGGSSFKKNGTV